MSHILVVPKGNRLIKLTTQCKINVNIIRSGPILNFLAFARGIEFLVSSCFQLIFGFKDVSEKKAVSTEFCLKNCFHHMKENKTKNCNPTNFEVVLS